MYDICIEDGAYISRFWDMTVKEIFDFMKAYNAREERRYKMNAAIAYKMGNLNAYAFHQPNKYPDINKAFPNLFEEKSSVNEPQDWKIMKERMIEYGNKFREKHLQEKKDSV